MFAYVIENNVLRCKTFMWSNLDSNLKDNILSILTVNAHSITGKFGDLETNLNLVKKNDFLSLVSPIRGSVMIHV